jgi:hypothetical protein
MFTLYYPFLCTGKLPIKGYDFGGKIWKKENDKKRMNVEAKGKEE